MDQLIDSGREILQSRPLDHERYDAWSDRARQAIAVAYGPNAAQTREFYKARWAISTLLSEDPSSHLTQVAANLRRELRALEKFERQGEPEISDEFREALRSEASAPAPSPAPAPAAPPAAAPPEPDRSRPMPPRQGEKQALGAAALAFSGGSAPASSTTTAPARAASTARNVASRPTRVLVLGGLDERATKAAVKTAESEGLTAVDVAEEYREALTQLGTSDASAEIAAALVFLDADPKSKSSKPSPRPESAVDLGVLMAALGPERVIAVVAETVALPRVPKEVTRLDQDDLSKLGAELRKRARA